MSGRHLCNRLWLAVALAMSVGATGPGCSSEPPRRAEGALLPPEPAARAPSFPEFSTLASFRALESFASSHPQPSRSATILVGPTAETYGQRLRPPMPEGALIVLKLDADTPEDTLYYVMRRSAGGSYPDGGDWEYGVVSSSGAVQEHGRLTACARCHAEAPREHLFEPPLEPASEP